MNYLEEVKKIIKIDVPDELLISVVFEMSRFADRKYTLEVKRLQKEANVVFDTPTRKALRRIFYYGKIVSHGLSSYNIRKYDYNNEEINRAFEDFYHRLKTYDSEKIVESMKRRIADLKANTNSDDNMQIWLNEYEKKRKVKKQYSLIAFKLDQEVFKKSHYDENILTDFILKSYNALENYRYMAIVVQGEIYNKVKECITWKLLYKAGIFAENFMQYTKHYFPFRRERQIENLTQFLKERNVKNASKLAKAFYSSISTGFRYEDCYISGKHEQGCKILIYKKIELDRTPVPCPSCNTTIQSGNSFPELFLRSWECKNPKCPERSKSGRGKRFDEYGVYRYFKLVENNEDNTISSELYQKFRRDIFADENDWMEFLIRDYSYAGERVLIRNCGFNKKTTLYNRNIECRCQKTELPKEAVNRYEELPIVLLYKSVFENSKLKKGRKKLENQIEIVNENSTDYLQTLKPGQIGTAITSPPYYNAREYSQWSTMIMYYIDMLLNCKAVYNAMAEGSYYLYNIGDIVSTDNVYVVSNMSNHRVQLGFLSAMIFELAGYTLTGNIIWDKGEVQSKRNSTVNLFSGYVKCVNCYEHIFVFRKGKYEKLSNTIEHIQPVIKINNKGENTYRHTAPYPIELVELVRPYVNKDLYVLDPYLGSGTTLKWCKKNDIKGVGAEMNKEYYDLCLENVYGINEQLSIFDLK